jgi:hypothetical protein
VATPITREGFRRWRRTRPFWGGLLLVLAGIELFWSANQTLGDLEVHFGPEGFLSYLLPVLLLLSGILVWVSPAQRLFYGILGLLTAVYSLIGLNFGGFVAGMLLGIVGGALVLAWAPRRTPVTAAPTAGAGPAASPGADPASSSGAGPAVAPDLPYGTPPQQQSSPEIVPGLHLGVDDTQEITAAPAPDQPPVHRKAFVLIFVPLAVTAAVLLAGGRVPARADEKCPEGVPSRSAGATPPAAAKKPATPNVSLKPSTKKPGVIPRITAPGSSAPRSPSSSSAPRSSAPGSSDDAEEGDGGTGDPLTDGLHDLVDGVHGLLGSPAASPSASASAGPSPAASDSPSTTPGPPLPTLLPSPSTTTPDPSAPAPTSAPASASPSATPSSDDIPCLGPRVTGKEASGDDVPMVSAQPGLLETDKLTLTNSTYDGVAVLQTARGPMSTLKFSMDTAENQPFSLTLPKQNGLTTLIKSDKLITDGNVRFYTPKMQGKLFGLIPVTFTPQQPPPLTLPTLVFTDVTIYLAFITCDTLTADPLSITKKD